MKKNFAKKVYKKAEELKSLIKGEDYTSLCVKKNNHKKLTSKESEYFKELNKMLEAIDKIEAMTIDLARPKGTMSWSEFREVMTKANSTGKHILGVIVYKASSFKKEYRDLDERSYKVSSDSKVFDAGAGGYSLFGTNLTGTDECVRLERIGWEIEYCYLINKD